MDQFLIVWGTMYIAPAFGYWITGAIHRIPEMWSHVDGALGFVAFSLVYIIEGSMRLTFFPIILMAQQ